LFPTPLQDHLGGESSRYFSARPAMAIYVGSGDSTLVVTRASLLRSFPEVVLVVLVDAVVKASVTSRKLEVAGSIPAFSANAGR
jgi:hypothetical protein